MYIHKVCWAHHHDPAVEAPGKVSVIFSPSIFLWSQRQWDHSRPINHFVRTGFILFFRISSSKRARPEGLHISKWNFPATAVEKMKGREGKGSRKASLLSIVQLLASTAACLTESDRHVNYWKDGRPRHLLIMMMSQVNRAESNMYTPIKYWIIRSWKSGPHVANQTGCTFRYQCWCLSGDKPTINKLAPSFSFFHQRTKKEIGVLWFESWRKSLDGCRYVPSL